MSDIQFQQLLDVKDRIIEQQQEKITLVEQLAEARRLHLMAQCKELAQHREFSLAFEHPIRAVCWLLFHQVWPFSIWYGRHEG
jgi:hypothetical protein